MNTKDFGSGYEQVDLAGEISDRDMTEYSTDELIAFAQEQIELNRITIAQIRRGQAELDKIQNEMYMQWVEDNYNETIHHDDMPDVDKWDEYAQWLIETEMPVE